MSSVSLAIPGIPSAQGARPAYSGIESAAYADPRLLGIRRPQEPPPPPAGGDLSSMSDRVRDRVTLSANVRQSPRPDRSAPRRQPYARTQATNPDARSLADLAETVADRITLSRPPGFQPTAEGVYSRRGTLPAEAPPVDSPALDSLAAGVADQLTLTAAAPGGAAEITVHIAGGGRAPSAPGPFFGFFSPLPAAT